MQQRDLKHIGSRVLQVVALPVCLRPFFNYGKRPRSSVLYKRFFKRNLHNE